MKVYFPNEIHYWQLISGLLGLAAFIGKCRNK